MECKKCNNPLSIFDVDRSIWVGQIEEVFFICPKCNSESKFVSRLFEKDHISKSFLEMLMNDCEKKEKHLNYLPNEQRSALLTHLVSCQYCTEKLEEMKLTKILKEMKTNKFIYNFFTTQATEISKVLTDKEIETNNIGIKSFKFNRRAYAFSNKHLFYDCKKENKRLLCYTLEYNSSSVGMVSFLKSKKQVVLHKIWMKSKQRLEKEKVFLNNLRTGDMKTIASFIKRSYNFL